MPTIIDSLIVELALETKDFALPLRVTKEEFAKASEEFQRLSSKSSEGFKGIGPQSRRTGNEVAAGIGLGTTALNNMVAAGLAAYGAIKAVHGAMGELSRVVVGGAQTGRSAAAAGLPGNFMSAFGIGAKILSNADTGQTEQWLASLRQQIDTLKVTGEQGSILKALNFLNIDWTKLDTEEGTRQTLVQLHERMSKMTPDMAINHGERAGMSPELAKNFHDRTLEETVSQGAPFAVTQRQIELFTALQQAINRYHESWDALIRKMVEDHPALKDLIDGLADFNKDLKDSPDKMKVVETAVDALAIAFGVTLVAGIVKATTALNAFWFTPAVKFLLSHPAFLTALGSYALGTALAPDFPAASVPHVPGESMGDYMRRNREAERGAEPASPPDTRHWWQKGPSWLPFSKPRDGSGGTPGPGGAAASGELPPEVYAAISRAEGTYGASGINYNMLPGGGTADLVNNSIANAIEVSRKMGDGVGGFQELHSTVASAVRALGMDPDKEKFSPENQRKIAAWIHGEQGLGAWHGFNAHPEELARAQAAMRAGGLARFSQGNAVPGGPSPVTDLNPEFAGRISRMVAAMPEELRERFGIISGYRSRERQQEVHPSVTDSAHSYGMAADLAQDPEVLDWNTRNGGRFGVGFPLASDPKEVNHLEPLEGGNRVSPADRRAWVAAHSPRPTAAARSPFPPGTKLNSRGEPYAADLETMSAQEKEKVEASMRAIHSNRHWSDLPKSFNLINSAKAAEGGRGTTNVNHGDVAVNGPILVHTQATDAGGIARDITGELRRQLRTTNANTGLE